MGKNKEIVFSSDLRAFFYEELDKLNNKSSFPLTQENIFYSSTVLEKFNSPEVLFENNEGRFQEKALGIKLLELSHLDDSKKSETLKDIADSALFYCGYFRNSTNKKLVNLDYYTELGKKAYKQLNTLEPVYFDTPSFFVTFAKVFEHTSELINIFSTKVHQSFDKSKKYII